MADISFCVALTASDIKLSGDHGAGLAPDGILDVIHGSDQDLSCWNLLQISNGCLDLGKHGAFLELTFCHQCLGLRNGESLQCSLILFAVIFINAGNTGQDDQLITV